MKNTETPSRFSYQSMFEIQSLHLLRWAKVLKPEVYVRLAEEVQKRNAAGYNRPDDVCRGTEIDSIVFNIQLNS